MRDWKVKVAQIHKRYAELDIEAHSEQEAIQIAEAMLKEEPEHHWAEYELEDQYINTAQELPERIYQVLINNNGNLGITLLE